MRFEYSSHLLLELNEDTGLSLMIDNDELFDFIDDYLTETCNFTYSHREIGEGKFKYHINLDNYELEEIKHALSELNLDEIERICSDN